MQEFDINSLIEKCNLSVDNIKNAERKLSISMEDFYDDYCKNQYPKLESEKQKLLNLLFGDASSQSSINSLRARVKDPYHLIGKIVRKTLQKDEYKNISLDNYLFYIDDIIGFRIITLYSEDWFEVHKYLGSKLNINDAKFVSSKQDLADHFQTLEDMTLFKKVEINIRPGDEDIYSSCVGGDFEKLFEKKDGRYYRSIHYSVYNNNYCFEIQVRSIYDEAWSEIDHNLLYPYYLDNNPLIEFSKLLNRVSGLSNELSAYFREIVKKESRSASNTLSSVPDLLYHEDYMLEEQNRRNNPINQVPEEKRTAQNIIDGIKEI